MWFQSILYPCIETLACFKAEPPPPPKSFYLKNRFYKQPRVCSLTFSISFNKSVHIVL